MDAKFVSLTNGVTQITPLNPSKTGNTASETAKASSADVVKIAGLPSEEAGADNVARLPVDENALEELVGNLNQSIQPTSRALKFSIDRTNGRPVVAVVDKETDEVIRQIPPEVALQVADALDEATGTLVSERA